MADAKLTALSELSVPTLDDLAYIVDDPAGTPASYKVAQNRLGGMYAPATCQGRLTTESGVPVSTSDRTAQSTIYFTPYTGDRVALYDGTRWKLYAFTQRSLALSGLTASLPYDVCLYDNAGTLTLELTAWTNATTRATALTTQDGVWVKTGATTRRYVGTIYTTGTTTTEDSGTKRLVWNAQGRVRRPINYQCATAAYTYNSTTIRQVGGDSANQIVVVCGLAGDAVLAIASVLGSTTYPENFQTTGMGEDSTTAFATDAGPMSNGYYLSVQLSHPSSAGITRAVPLGYHVYTWLEKCVNSSRAVDVGPTSGTDSKTGLFGWYEA